MMRPLQVNIRGDAPVCDHDRVLRALQRVRHVVEVLRAVDVPTKGTHPHTSRPDTVVGFVRVLKIFLQFVHWWETSCSNRSLYPRAVPEGVPVRAVHVTNLFVRVAPNFERRIATT